MVVKTGAKKKCPTACKDCILISIGVSDFGIIAAKGGKHKSAVKKSQQHSAASGPHKKSKQDISASVSNNPAYRLMSKPRHPPPNVR